MIRRIVVGTVMITIATAGLALAIVSGWVYHVSKYGEY